MPNASSTIVGIFPSLSGQGAFVLNSPPDEAYNCIAFAAGDTMRWWWPNPLPGSGIYWPEEAPDEASIPAFIAAFGSVGYECCEEDDADTGYEMIAIFAIRGEPTHAARQQVGGSSWLSKLGEEEDIIHHDLEGVNGSLYGQPVQFMRRQIQSDLYGHE